LSKAGITNVPDSIITGDIGTSPITGAALTALSCSEITGTIYVVDAAGPRCSDTDTPTISTSPILSQAILDMGVAYTDAAGRTNPDEIELGAGNIGGRTLVPGLYKWSTGLTIMSDLTFSGSEDSVWIFQVSGTVNLGSGVEIKTELGAQAKNIFWQVTGAVVLGTNSHFEGVLLGWTSIAVLTDASVNGQLFAHTAVTLQKKCCH